MKRININEKHLKQIVSESVKKVMNEQYTQGDINNAFQQWQQQGLNQIRNGQQGQQTPVQSMGNENAIYKSSALISKAKYLYQYLMNNDINSASQMLQPISDLLEGIEQDILSHQKDTQYRNSMQ